MGRTQQEITSSFVFEEAINLVSKGILIHAHRCISEGESSSCGIAFHGYHRKLDFAALHLTTSNLSFYPLVSLLASPGIVYWQNLCASSVARTANDNQIDLIHAHFAYPHGLIGCLAKKRAKKPLAITVHGYDVVIDKASRYGARLDKRIDYMIRKALNKSDCIFASSNEMYEEVTRLVDNHEKVHLVPNGVDTQNLNTDIDGSAIRKKLGITSKFVVFTLRSHEPKYGIEYLIRAAEIVCKQKKNIAFVIAGDGSLRDYHQNLVAELGIQNNVIFPGIISQSEKPFYFAMSDVCVVPSLQEAFGLVVSEAMACGKPVIASQVGGIPDQVSDSKTGFLVQPRDTKAIAERIIWLADNPDEARRMGSAGRRIVESKFDLRERIDAIIHVYKELTN